MAFFEYLASLNELLSSALGKFIKPIGGQGSNDIFPSPSAGLPPNPGSSNAGLVVQDSDGSLRVRSSNLTTRQSLRDDFSGSALTTALTGTPSFTNGSTLVTGSGTAFTTELTRDHFIKVTAHAETTYARVRRVISNTSLELETAYTGATTAAASVKTKWPTTTGSGGSFTVGSSLLNILSGTTNGASSYVSRLFDFQPIAVQLNTLSITQRLSTQTTFAGFFDNVASPTQQVAIIFDGTVNTVVKFRTSFSASETQETSVTLPFGLTTNLSTVNYVLSFDGDSATLAINGVVVASHSVHLPDKYTKLIVAWGITNTGVPTTTTVSMDSIGVRAFDLMDDDAALNQNGIIINDEIHYITGALTTSAATADQVILSYTVPTGKVAYILGYSVSSNANVDGTPIKIGKNTITTEPAAPGTTDNNFFRILFLLRTSGPSSGIASDNFSACPRPFAIAGDVVKMTVTPSGAGTTIWRGTIDILLRKA